MKYVRQLASHGALGPLAPRWNCQDGEGFHPMRTALVHDTDMTTQPWRPYPDQVRYKPHPHRELENPWFEYAQRRARAGARKSRERLDRA